MMLFWDSCSNEADKLSQALTQDATEAVRVALQYEALHEEGDEDVGEPCQLLPEQTLQANLTCILAVWQMPIIHTLLSACLAQSLASARVCPRHCCLLASLPCLALILVSVAALQGRQSCRWSCAATSTSRS